VHQINILKQENERLTTEAVKNESKISSLTTENTHLQDEQSQKELEYKNELERLTLELENKEQTKREKALEFAVVTINGLIEANPTVSLNAAERNAIRLICQRVLPGGVSGEKPAGGGRAPGAKGTAKHQNTSVAKSSSAKPSAKPAGSDSVAGDSSSGPSSRQQSGGSEADQGSSTPSRSNSSGNSSGSGSDGPEHEAGVAQNQHRDRQAKGIPLKITPANAGGGFATPPSVSSEDNPDKSAKRRVDPTDIGGSAKASNEGSGSTSDGSGRSYDAEEASSEARSEPEVAATIGLTGCLYGSKQLPGARRSDSDD
jgi:hypothetical protein